MRARRSIFAAGKIGEFAAAIARRAQDIGHQRNEFAAFVEDVQPGLRRAALARDLRDERARLFAAALPMMQHLKSARAFLVNDANDSEKNGQPEDAHFVREFIAKIDAVLADATGAV